MVCLLDDAQWLDRASTQCLTFVARRLMAERVAFVFAARDHGAEAGLAGLPELAVSGLADRDARLVLTSGLRGALRRPSPRELWPRLGVIRWPCSSCTGAWPPPRSLAASPSRAFGTCGGN